MDNGVFIADIKCFHDNSEDEERIYDVYLASCNCKQYVLKKTTKEEVDIYEKYLSEGNFKVPKYYDLIKIGNDYWILTSFIEGVNHFRGRS